ncbi:MAG TPA: hypothetical protein DCP49_07395 [Erysipelotrichaceae bacterium]|nr:hypothetical protein [Erysipelotrichaceae bacterium]
MTYLFTSLYIQYTFSSFVFLSIILKMKTFENNEKIKYSFIFTFSDALVHNGSWDSKILFLFLIHSDHDRLDQNFHFL